MFNHDEGSMPYDLGEAAFNAVFGPIATYLERAPWWLEYILFALAILTAGWLVVAFFRNLVNNLHAREAEQDRLDQEVLLDLAHRGEQPHGW